MSAFNNRNQGMEWNKRRRCFTILHSLFFIFFFCGQAMAVQTCKTTSITATTPTADFTDNSNGTVTHTKTGLMWKRCSEGQIWSGSTCTGTATTYTWQAALQHAETLNNSGGFAGFNDWRVPNIKELASILESQCVNPTLNAVVFPATPIAGVVWYWSASPFSNLAYRLNFNDASEGQIDKGSSGNVRLVRGGQ